MICHDGSLGASSRTEAGEREVVVAFDDHRVVALSDDHASQIAAFVDNLP